MVECKMCVVGENNFEEGFMVVEIQLLNQLEFPEFASMINAWFPEESKLLPFLSGFNSVP